MPYIRDQHTIQPRNPIQHTACFCIYRFIGNNRAYLLLWLLRGYNRDCTACNLAFYRKRLPTSALSSWPTPEITCRVSCMPRVLCLSARRFLGRRDAPDLVCNRQKCQGINTPGSPPPEGEGEPVQRSWLPILLLGQFEDVLPGLFGGHQWDGAPGSRSSGGS